MRKGADQAQIPERAPATAKAEPAPDKKGRQKAESARRGRGKQTHVDTRGRESRAQEDANELFERVDEDREWERPTSLGAPPARPGYKQRWIRVGYEGSGHSIDEKNLAKKLREGWRARHSSTIPRNFHLPRVRHGRFAGCVMVEGMLLCEMPLSLAKSRQAKIRSKIDEQTRAIDEQLRQANAGAVRGGFGPIRRGQASRVLDRREVESIEGKPGRKQDEEPEEAVL